MGRLRRGLGPATRELALIAALYLFYCAARTAASSDLRAATARATQLRRLERVLHLPGEGWFNRLATDHAWVGVTADYWYASLHYLVTAGALVWLFGRGRTTYVHARRALVLATLVALGFYLTLPTAPPRMMDGFTDIMALHSDLGWWGSSGSAPQGLGGLTNELAALPSMHAGWALWVALAIWSVTASRLLRWLGVVYALGTDVVVVVTANHWLVDVVLGQAIIAAAWWVVHRTPSAPRPARVPGEVAQPTNRYAATPAP
ncbi:inositol phosphorylceramide synthase [Nocardioides phosphati]|uniref:Inositol phosphorylceramide synthase n=1 Tax=Nocardioides phosphati TaxID=1867775 RepID=A0ABQ2NC45_9ACTN|nr:phosphatase PAP2 family protein [Nocardioides phosphati]GGO89986.1 inositol phosphorylceramide synthase [Nocardioides phosphati]